MDLTTVYHPIETLIFAEYNPRQLTKDQYKSLRDSMERFGLVDPIIINKHPDRENIVIGGHQRLRIAKDMGIDRIPCVELSLDLNQEKELNVRLNRNVGEWDYDALANYFDVGELTEWGFTKDDLQFWEDEPVEGLIDDDEIPEVSESITKMGDVWFLGEHRVMCGNATKEGDVGALMGEERADMVFTDPPYNVDYRGQGSWHKTGKKWDKLENDNLSKEEFEEFLASAFINYMNFSTDKASLYLCHADRSSIEFRAAFENVGYSFRTTIIWVKQKAAFNNAHYKYKHEPIYYCYKEGKTVNWHGALNENTVWEIKRAMKNEFHSTQKPVELVVRAIKNSTQKDQMVVDFFSGGGSTLIACEKTGRKCYGMEINPHYCDVIVKRWEKFTGKEATRLEAAHA